MSRFTRAHLSDSSLLDQFDSRISLERGTTAEMLADIAEIDERRLYAPAGYSSMFAFCVEAKGFTADEAAKRIQAARAARDFPRIFEMLADGRLHLTAVVVLAPNLREESAAGLLEAAAGKTG